AFEFFGGVPRVLLYDNLKSAVLERAGDAIRFHPTLLELAAHYHYLPRPVAPARGNQKAYASYCIPSDLWGAPFAATPLPCILLGRVLARSLEEVVALVIRGNRSE